MYWHWWPHCTWLNISTQIEKQKTIKKFILHPLDSHLYQMLTNLKRGIYGLKTFLRYENCVMIGIQRENMYEADVEAKSEDVDGTSFQSLFFHLCFFSKEIPPLHCTNNNHVWSNQIKKFRLIINTTGLSAPKMAEFSVNKFRMHQFIC